MRNHVAQKSRFLSKESSLATSSMCLSRFRSKEWEAKQESWIFKTWYQWIRLTNFLHKCLQANNLCHLDRLNNSSKAASKSPMVSILCLYNQTSLLAFREKISNRIKCSAQWMKVEAKSNCQSLTKMDSSKCSSQQELQFRNRWSWTMQWVLVSLAPILYAAQALCR